MEVEDVHGFPTCGIEVGVVKKKKVHVGLLNCLILRFLY